MDETFEVFVESLKNVLSMPFFQVAFALIFLFLGITSILILVVRIQSSCNRYPKINKRDSDSDDDTPN